MAATLLPKIFTLPDMCIQSWPLRDGILSIALQCQRTEAVCPDCGIFSTHIHGWYACQIHDLPCQGLRVRLNVDVRRFQCRNTACHRSTFAETLPIACRYQRRSQRLQQVHARVGLILGGVPGANLLQRLGMTVSGDTLLRTLQRLMTRYETTHPCAALQEIGIDAGPTDVGMFMGPSLWTCSAAGRSTFCQTEIPRRSPPGSHDARTSAW